MPKILLVEDNEMNRDMLSRRLQRKGYEVLIAVDGGQGVAMAESGLAELRHNLRTPVNHILGYSEMMIEDLEEQGQLDGCEQLRSLHAAGKQL